MNTTHPLALLADSPAASLARWQSLPLAERLDRLRTHTAPGYPCRPASLPPEPTRRDWLRALIHDPAFRPGILPTSRRRDRTGHPAPGMLYNVDMPQVSTVAETEHDRAWYVDDFQDAVIRGAAVILPQCPAYVIPCTIDPYGNGWTLHLDHAERIEFEDQFCASEYYAEKLRRHALDDACNIGDQIAERIAEEERDYQAKESLRCEIEENRAERATLRQELRDLIQEARDHCADLPPGIAKATQYAINYARHKLNKLALRNREILDQITP